MIWRSLIFGTAILASLTIGTAIYYSEDRLQVKTEDVVELLGGINQCQLALSTSITTQRIGYQIAQWSDATPAVSWDGTNLLNGYWSYDGTSNAAPASYKVPIGEITQSNTFITTGQWLRAWVPIYESVGRVRDIPNSQYTITANTGESWYDETLNGTYNWSTSLWTSSGIDCHVYLKTDESVVLVGTPRDENYGWQIGLIYGGSPADWRNNVWDMSGSLRSGQYGGSLTAPQWDDPYYDAIHVTAAATGISLEGRAITNISVQSTNINIIRFMEFPARTLTNIANAVQLQNYSSTIEYIDGAISTLAPSFVDMSQASDGRFDTYFATHPSATVLPKLSLRRAFEILGPTCGTNIAYGLGMALTNSLWLTYPARGTNSAVYGGTIFRVTPEILKARFKVLQLFVATERSPTWWTGTKEAKQAPPPEYGSTTNYYDASAACAGATAWANGLQAPPQNFTIPLSSLLSNISTVVTGQSPASVAQVYSFQLSPSFTSWLSYDPLNALYTHGTEPYPHHFWGVGYHPAVPSTSFLATLSGAGTNAGSLGWYVTSSASTGASATVTYYTTKSTARVNNIMLPCLEEAQFYARDYTNGQAYTPFSKRADGDMISAYPTNYVLSTVAIEPLPPPADYLSLTVTAPLKTNWVSALCGEGWYVLDPNGSGWGYNYFGLIEDLTYAGMPDDLVNGQPAYYGLWPHNTMFSGEYVWTYRYTGEAQGSRTWTSTSTNRPNVTKTVAAGPVLLKWDFPYCRP